MVAFKPDSGDASEALASIGEARSLGMADLFLVRLRPSQPTARAAWSHVLRMCPTALWACPVVVDAEGNELYATGSIVVRFREPPSGKALGKIAGKVVMRVEGRNEFVPRQVSIRPHRPRDVYLPELVASIAKRPEVEAAWLSTRGTYRRV